MTKIFVSGREEFEDSIDNWNLHLDRIGEITLRTIERSDLDYFSIITDEKDTANIGFNQQISEEDFVEESSGNEPIYVLKLQPINLNED